MQWKSKLFMELFTSLSTPLCTAGDAKHNLCYVIKNRSLEHLYLIMAKYAVVKWKQGR